MKEYLARVVDGEITERMQAMGAVVLEGPKACGKTEAAKRVSRTVLRLDVDQNARQAIGVSPELVLGGEAPLLLDEWQVEPALWDLVRREVDDRGLPGQFILTGSAVPRDNYKRHSGAGRFGFVRMRPMTLWESGHSTGDISLARILNREEQKAREPGMSIRELVERIVIGGWPHLIGASEKDARAWLADYLTQVAETDVPSMGHRKNPARVRRLLQSLGRSTGQAPRMIELEKDMGGPKPVASETLTEHLETLDRLRLTENAPAFQVHMRSTASLRTSEVRYFIDPSIGVAAMGMGSKELLLDLNATGFQFESMVLRDLRTYAQRLGGTVSTWRDTSHGHEVDAIVQTRDGWAAVEIKMNVEHIDRAAQSLKRFASLIDTSRTGSPAALVVVTANGYGYRREDGVQVVPIAALRP